VLFFFPTAAGVSYDFRQSTMMKARLMSLRNSGHYFPKGYGRTPEADSVPDPRQDQTVVFKDFFTAALRMAPHPVLLDILRMF
jgi:hypothetical protein